MNRPTSIGQPLAQTECRVLDGNDREVAPSEPGELVMRGPQFMLGYWKEPQATAAVLRDGWYWSGDIVNRDDDNFFYVLDRRKEMIKYKGFPVAPAEVEAVLMEHPVGARLRSSRPSQRRRRRNPVRLRGAPRRLNSPTKQ